MTEPPNDLEQKKNVAKTASGKSASELSRELEEANRKIRNHNAERIIFVLVLLLIWNDYTFKGNEGWAPVAAKLCLELVGLFIVAYRFELHEVIGLYWSMMRAYGKKDPGDSP